MKKGKVVRKMTSVIPWTFSNTESVIDEEKRIKVRIDEIRWESHIPKEDIMIVSLGEQQFEYPSLDELRVQFKTTGLYTNEQINGIIEVYERLPKYRAQRSSAPRSPKRSTSA